MFSLELPENATEIDNGAFGNCFCLRNVAFPPNAILFGDYIFLDEDEMQMDELMDTNTDLQRLFGDSDARIISELQHRFDGLPIHRLIYYQTYYQGVLQILLAAINTRSGQRRTLRSKLDPTGNQQDCLGMTPLHILTCSSVHNLEMYRVIVENYPANLITEDRWGALPLLYAFWGTAPSEIIQFLLESYHSLYPNHEFNWTMMVETMGRHTPKKSIENLLRVKQMHFPEQPIDWEYLLIDFAQPFKFHPPGVLFQEQMCFLFISGMSDRVEALAFKVWRDFIMNMIHTADFASWGGNQHIILRIRAKVAQFEGEIPKLKEVTTILELALWKMRMDEKSYRRNMTRSICQMKMTSDESDIRRQCRVTCGADVVIDLVSPFLITVLDEES
jgi:hypothetical protein